MQNKVKTAMLPIGPLMIEHRLIERMVILMERELKGVRIDKQISMIFLTSAIDFLKFYADRCHHGKEEDILFKELDKKPLSAGHRVMMKDLKQDHVRARGLVAKLASDVNESYSLRTSELLRLIAKDIKDLVKLYREHIRKEDKQFFIPVMKYFSKQERDNMLCVFREFDRTLIHEKYKSVVSQFEEGVKA